MDGLLVKTFNDYIEYVSPEAARRQLAFDCIRILEDSKKHILQIFWEIYVNRDYVDGVASSYRIYCQNYFSTAFVTEDFPVKMNCDIVEYVLNWIKRENELETISFTVEDVLEKSNPQKLYTISRLFNPRKNKSDEIRLDLLYKAMDNSVTKSSLLEYCKQQ